MSQSGQVTGSGSSGSVLTLTGNSGGPVSPTAGNINTVGTGSITIVGSPGTSTLTTQLTGLTPFSLLAGNTSNSIASLGAASNGQLPIGSTGTFPVMATLTAGTNISITNGAGSITISADTTSETVNYTSVNNAASPYTVLTTDFYLGVDTSGGAVTLRFPNAPSTGRIFVVKDKAGTAAASNITVTTVGGAVNFDGATSYVMNSAYAAISLIFNGTSYEIY